jgi:hypothetical protein
VQERIADRVALAGRAYDNPARAVAVCVAVGFVVNAAFYGVIFVLSLFFQRALGLSALGAGLPHDSAPGCRSGPVSSSRRWAC